MFIHRLYRTRVRLEFIYIQSRRLTPTIIHMNDVVMTPFLKKIAQVPNRPPAIIGEYISKSYNELFIKSSLLEESLRKNIVDTKHNFQK